MLSRPQAQHVSVSAVFYNVGIQNKEVTSKYWRTWKRQKLKDDIQKVFDGMNGVTMMFISEFGSMFDSVDDDIQKKGFVNPGVCRKTPALANYNRCANTERIFEEILDELGLHDILVLADAPYVALIDKHYWRIRKRETVAEICSTNVSKDTPYSQRIFVQHLVVQDCETGTPLRIFNVHMPTSHATNQRKKDAVFNMLAMTANHECGGIHGNSIPWIIGGDLNVDAGNLMRWLREAWPTWSWGDCLSRSEVGAGADAQKADHALSQFINLLHRRSMVGKHSPPCASDVHDGVLVLGFVELPSGSMECETGSRSSSMECETGSMEHQPQQSAAEAVCSSVQQRPVTTIWDSESDGDSDADLVQVVEGGEEKPLDREEQRQIHQSLQKGQPMQKYRPPQEAIRRSLQDPEAIRRSLAEEMQENYNALIAELAKLRAKPLAGDMSPDEPSHEHEATVHDTLNRTRHSLDAMGIKTTADNAKLIEECCQAVSAHEYDEEVQRAMMKAWQSLQSEQPENNRDNSDSAMGPSTFAFELKPINEDVEYDSDTALGCSGSPAQAAAAVGEATTGHYPPHRFSCNRELQEAWARSGGATNATAQIAVQLFIDEEYERKRQERDHERRKERVEQFLQSEHRPTQLQQPEHNSGNPDSAATCSGGEYPAASAVTRPQAANYRELELHRAASDNKARFVETLLGAGAHRNLHNADGDTALHCAARNGHAEVTQVLLRARANSEAIDRQERTPLDVAHENGHDAVAELLLNSGARAPMPFPANPSKEFLAIWVNVLDYQRVKLHRFIPLVNWVFESFMPGERQRRFIASWGAALCNY